MAYSGSRSFRSRVAWLGKSGGRGVVDHADLSNANLQVSVRGVARNTNLIARPF